jgi:hypothetical protein
LMDELSVELADEQHARPNRTQALRLLAASGLTESDFEHVLYEARSIVRDEVNRRRLSGDGVPIRNRGAFFFATLRNLLKRDGRSEGCGTAPAGPGGIDVA